MFMYVEMRKYMKKKLFSVLLVGALAASLVACGKTEKKEAKASTANTEINAEEYAGTIEAYTYPDEFAKCNGESEMQEQLHLMQEYIRHLLIFQTGKECLLILRSQIMLFLIQMLRIISRACLNQRLQLML